MWWRFDVAMGDMQLWSRLQKGAADSLDGDPCINDPPRIMRLPGFVNTKPERNGARAELVACIAERTYPVDEFPERAETTRPEPSPVGRMIRRTW